jgi:uncharacterized phage protein (TIGR01671 family)|tara:strand:+ start:89 stop:469 length:381 start_codon:yes stop_codon:yes gene_type:complete
MEEYRFRAWIAASEKMISHKEVIKNSSYWFSGDLFIEDELMMYTGIKDKKGRMIYEGDIVEYWLNEDIVNGRIVMNRRSIVETVTFANGSFCFDETDEIVFGAWIWECEPKVIGNIHQEIKHKVEL